MSPAMARHLEEPLLAQLRGMGSVVVAFSGGVDSTVVAGAAQRALGERALAVTLRGPAVARDELEMARRVASTIPIRHREVELDPLSDARYVANPTDRCYFCRSQEGARLRDLARAEGYAFVVDGVHRDDLGDDRPGLRALKELGVRHPLLEAGLGKDGVRELARAWGLPNHDAPSNSCLASRVAHGEPITAELLDRVERAERALKAHGFRRVRVRTSGGSAKIEVGAEEVARFDDRDLTSQVERDLLSLGFRTVTVDPLGYRPAGGRTWGPKVQVLPSPPSGMA